MGDYYKDLYEKQSEELAKIRKECYFYRNLIPNVKLKMAAMFLVINLLVLVPQLTPTPSDDNSFIVQAWRELSYDTQVTIFVMIAIALLPAIWYIGKGFYLMCKWLMKTADEHYEDFLMKENERKRSTSQ